MESVLVDRIESSLRQFMPRNAIFFSELLCAHSSSEPNFQLLANCYLRNNQAYCAYHILKGRKMPHSRYLFAISCVQMNLLREAELALCPPNEPNAEVPSGAAGLYLLGFIYRYTGRSSLAIEKFTQALSIDPLLWVAYEELCILGAAEEANECFNNTATLRIQEKYLCDARPLNSTCDGEDQNLPIGKTQISKDLSPRQLKQHHSNSMREVSAHAHLVSAGHVTNSWPTFPLYNTPSPTTMQLSSIAPPPICRNAQIHGNAVGDGYVKANLNPAIQAPRRKFVDEGKLRKVSGRLFPDSVPRRSTRLSGEAKVDVNSNTMQPGGNGNSHSSTKFFSGFSSSSSKTSSGTFPSVTVRKSQSWAVESIDEGRSETFDDSRTEYTRLSSTILADARCTEQEKLKYMTLLNLRESTTINGIVELLGLLRILGEGYRLSCTHRSQDAVEVYQKLPQNHYNTGWVLCQMGKAYSELVEYFEADRCFQMARQLSPYTLEGMDIYSTVLYHLRDEMKLCYLAQELISIDRLSPQAWCAMGNFYSLRKDHETALKNFQRAVHLDSRFTYAHTLCGHEYVSLEDFDNGIKCYQSALQVDERHHNSWYGLGFVYFRQEKFQFAEHHFRKAYHINPHSSVLMCYLGMSLYTLKRNAEALDMIENSILADNKNPLPIFHKANILAFLGRYDEALMVLEHLKEHAPRESGVYVLIGRIYKRLNMHEKSFFNFSVALDLKPPAADVALIKSAMEKLNIPDELVDSP